MAMVRCCEDGNCLKTELSRLFDPDSAIEDRVTVAACAVAHTCKNLECSELEFCFTKLFDTPSDCRLCEQFVVAYQIERDAIAGKREIDRKKKAANAGPNIDQF